MTTHTDVSRPPIYEDEAGTVFRITDLPEFMQERAMPVEDGCWLWTGGAGSYGQMRWEGRLTYTHRVAYSLLVGEIGEGLEIHHLYKTKMCFNPAHLQPVSQRTNTRLGWGWRDADTCPRGHVDPPTDSGCIPCRRLTGEAGRRAKIRLSREYPERYSQLQEEEIAKLKALI